MIRRIIKILLLVVLGLVIGLIAYQIIMFIRISHLRSENPITTSLIEARVAEAKSNGEQPKRMQIWVLLDQISPNLQRAVLAGEDTNFATHNGFDYKAIQKAWDQGFLEAAKEAKKEGNLPERN
jgi:monofunctional biosynthetic peptidoglycan transglycosylase